MLEFQNKRTKFSFLALPFKADTEKAPEDLQMKLFNLHCDANLNRKFPETKL
jgi:hypothetical protein